MRLMLLIISYSLLVSCSKTPKPVYIIHVGDCEHGIVTGKNLDDTRKIWTDAQITDVLISGGCYQDKFIKKWN